MNHLRLVLVVSVLACTGDDPATPATPLTGEAPPTPTLVEESPVVPPLDAYVVGFGMGAGPQFLTRARAGSPGALIRFGPGRATLYVARVGDGPGEVRDVPFLDITDSTLVAFDFANARLAIWDTAGAFVRHVRLRGTPLMSGEAGARGWLGISLGTPTRRPLTIDAMSGREVYLLPARDSFLVAELGVNEFGEPTLGSVGRWGGGFLVANGRSYRIAGYDWEARLRFVIAPEQEPNLPSAQRLEELLHEWRRSGRPGRRSEAQMREYFAETPEQWFSHLAPPRMDSAGRVWVVGRAHGQLFADAWWRDLYLGRTLLDCPGWYGRWNLAGNHIALPCANDDPESDVDHVYRIWRIEADTASAGS